MSSLPPLSQPSKVIMTVVILWNSYNNENVYYFRLNLSNAMNTQFG